MNPNVGSKPFLPQTARHYDASKTAPAVVEGDKPQENPTDAVQSNSGLSSKEFKMLLDPKRFKNVESGMEKLWDRVEGAADESGVEVKKAKKDEVRKQDIIFLDTPEHTLKEQGYILRYRDMHGGSKDDNLTLKFRDLEQSTVEGSNVEAAPQCSPRAKAKVELDETFQDTQTSIYSKSTKIKVPHLPKTTVENMTEYFPVLGELGLAPGTHLKQMHEGGIVEDRHLLGNVKIGEFESAPAYLTLWYDDDHKKTPAIAEFSFAHPAHDAESGVDQQSESMMHILHDDAPEWICHGSTKTNFAYGS